jgi:hypothetical protein
MISNPKFLTTTILRGRVYSRVAAAGVLAVLAACGGGGDPSADSSFSGSSSSSSSSSSSGATSSSSSSSSSSGSSSGGTALWPPAVVATPTTCVSQPMTGPHATYNVGPGETYTSLTNVPWLSLQAGDVVNIYYQPTPYATKLAIQAVGTAAQPVVINGVTDANCNRPIITGANAVTTADSIAAGFWASTAGTIVEPEGVIVFLWGPTQPYATRQSYVTIQNVEVTGAEGTNTFTNHSGQVVHYDTSGAYAFYGVAVDHTTIQYDTIDANDGGVFFNTQDDQRFSSFVTLRGNDFFNNGLNGSDLVHNIYVQGVRSLYEGNFLGNEIASAQGSSLKDRSSGPVIRNNYIIASARAIDLVDPEGGDIVQADPLYNYGWVYGNVIVDNCALGICSTDLIHWGGDSQGDQASSSNYHNGPLYFYYNTVVVENDSDPFVRIGIFDMPSNQQSVNAADNIIWFNLSGANDTFELGICCGTINLVDANWISAGYVASGESGATVTLNNLGTVLVGANPLLNADLTLSATSGSPIVREATAYPTSVPNAAASVPNLQVVGQYSNSTIGIVARPNVSDLGAYAAH